MSALVACTDGSAYAPSVYDHSAWAAKRLGVPVRVLHASPSPGRSAAALLASARHHLVSAGIERVTTESSAGTIDTAIAPAAEGEIVVIGKRGEDADLVRTSLGRNVERLVRRRSGVFLVAARKFRPITSALLAFDGSASAQHAVSFAARSPLFEEVALHLMGTNLERPELGDELAQARDQLLSAGRAVTWELNSVLPDTAIASAVRRKDAALAIMGTRGHSSVRDSYLGTTTQTILTALPISVLLFRAS